MSQRDEIADVDCRINTLAYFRLLIAECQVFPSAIRHPHSTLSL